jgi:hypothetical protein
MHYQHSKAEYKTKAQNNERKVQITNSDEAENIAVNDLNK